MAGREAEAAAVQRCSDVILYQHIDDGWQYDHTSDGDTYRGFHRDPALARTLLLRKLGWAVLILKAVRSALPSNRHYRGLRVRAFECLAENPSMVGDIVWAKN